MTGWLDQLRAALDARGEAIGATDFLTLLAVSVAAAFVVALLYDRFYGRRATGSEIHRAFPLLALAITAIFVCIQFSLPLSLGLLGALSIVRFRTPIKEPEEIGFLMVVIATSLAAATGRVLFLGIVVVAAAAALLAQELLRPVFRRRKESGLVIATFEESRYEAARSALFETLGAAARSGELESLVTQDGRVTVTWRFRGLASDAAPELERKLRTAARPESLAIVFASGAP